MSGEFPLSPPGLTERQDADRGALRPGRGCPHHLGTPPHPGLRRRRDLWVCPEQGLLGRLGHQGGVKGGVGLFLPSHAVSPGHLARPRGALAGPEQVPCEPRGASADGVRCGPSFSPESITQNRLPQRGCLLVTTCASRTLVQGSVTQLPFAEHFRCPQTTLGGGTCLPIFV